MTAHKHDKRIGVLLDKPEKTDAERAELLALVRERSAELFTIQGA